MIDRKHQAKMIRKTIKAKNIDIVKMLNETGLTEKDLEKIMNGRKVDEHKVVKIGAYLGFEIVYPVEETISKIDLRFDLISKIGKKERGYIECPICHEQAKFYRSTIDNRIHFVCNECATSEII